MGLLLQKLAKGFAEDSHAAAVDYADAGKTGEEGAVHEFLNFAGSIVDRLADDGVLVAGTGRGKAGKV